ncbi:hypothetical protein B0H11DRAFT_2295734 [Mycena galericulata]|nr:hypothetical protein B0H11DRAFT_2295734 [Mycena galericulata]
MFLPSFEPVHSVFLNSAASASSCSVSPLFLLHHHQSMDVDDPMSQDSANDLELPLVNQIHDFVVSTGKELGELVLKFPHIPREQHVAWKNYVDELSKSSLPPPFKLALVGETEVAYRDIDTIVSTVFFLSCDEWEEKIKYLLEDCRIKSKSSEKSWDTLRLVYPHIWDFTEVTPDELVQTDYIQKRLDTSVIIDAVNDVDFKSKLRPYLVSSASLDPALWLLVDRVEITGKFPILASGIVLIDLPGDGDIDDSRNGVSKQYMQEAHIGFILVANIKRAQDDRRTQERLQTILKRLTVDGRVAAKAVLVVATHADELESISKSMKLRAKHQGYSRKEFSAEYSEKLSQKSRFLANTRSAVVQRKLREVLDKLYTRYAPVTPETQVLLPIFCVGSRDYLSLKLETELPAVFARESQTQVPQLLAHLRNIAESRRIESATYLFDRGHAFLDEVDHYFSEGKHPGRLRREDKEKAIAIIADLKTRNEKEANDLLDGIEDEFEAINEQLLKAVKKAKENAPQIMRSFGNLHWNTYKAAMRRDGVFYPYDLNRDLTREIWSDIEADWSTRLNYRIPVILRAAIERIEQCTLSAVAEIVPIVQGPGLRPLRTPARIIGIVGTLGELERKTSRVINEAQRAARPSVIDTVKQELKSLYESASRGEGLGFWVQTKASNLTFMQQNADNIFQPINTRVRNLLHKLLTDVKQTVLPELSDISAHLRLSLIDEVNLPGEHKEQKERILKLTVERRPEFAKFQIDLADCLKKAPRQ